MSLSCEAPKVVQLREPVIPDTEQSTPKCSAISKAHRAIIAGLHPTLGILAFTATEHELVKTRESPIPLQHHFLTAPIGFIAKTRFLFYSLVPERILFLIE